MRCSIPDLFAKWKYEDGEWHGSYAYSENSWETWRKFCIIYKDSEGEWNPVVFSWIADEDRDKTYADLKSAKNWAISQLERVVSEARKSLSR